MAEPRPTPPSDDIERALHDLGAQLDWPAEPNLLPAVRQRLASQPPCRSLLARLWPASAPSRLVWVSAALIAVVALVLTVSDSTRSTIADRLGVPGISITTDPTATLTPGGALQLGTQATLDAAIQRASDNLVMPPDTVLGPPDAVYVLEQDGTVQVSYVYLPRSDLPEVGDAGVGLLISQFDGHTNDSFIQKQLGPETTIELTEVNQQPAFWLSGEPHVFFYEGPDGQIHEETIRLAANVLLWEQDDKTIRIETSLDRDSAIRIAEGMRSTRRSALP